MKLLGSDAFVKLDEGELIPLGTVIDTRRGRVTVVAAANGSGGSAKAVFSAGIFRIGQTKGKRPIAELTRVARGRVKVTDFGKRETVLVKAGHKYVARARR